MVECQFEYFLKIDTALCNIMVFGKPGMLIALIQHSYNFHAEMETYFIAAFIFIYLLLFVILFFSF